MKFIVRPFPYIARFFFGGGIYKQAFAYHRAHGSGGGAGGGGSSSTIEPVTIEASDKAGTFNSVIERSFVSTEGQL